MIIRDGTDPKITHKPKTKMTMLRMPTSSIPGKAMDEDIPHLPSLLDEIKA
jgi:hypothetical protein